MDSRVLGDYTIIKQIGQGALGVVYLAEHRFMKQQYALKVLPMELSTDRNFIHRFEEEVGKLAVLDHTNIVKIHNVSYAQGQYFLVSDCIVDKVGETTNLSQFILSRDGFLPEEQIFDFLHQIADALDYAHNKKVGDEGIIHQGLKLNNILVSEEKEGIRLFLSDFGLSRVIGTGAFLTRTYKVVAEALGLTQVYPTTPQAEEHYHDSSVELKKLSILHESFLQSFAFLAPEQKRINSNESLSKKTDIYAFGVLTYYLLMKKFPEGMIEMPKDKKWDWNRLIESCLHSDPQRRPDYLLEALDAIKTGGFVIEENIENPTTKEPQEEEHCTPHPTAEAILEQTQVKEKQEVLIPRNPNVKPDMLEEMPPKDLKPVIHTQKLERPKTDLDPAKVFEVDPTVTHYEPEQKEPKNIEPLMTEMVIVKGGSFDRGSNDGNRDEMPRHKIHIFDFAIDIHPVTNEQFVRFIEVLGGIKDSNYHDIIRIRDSRIKRSGGKLSIESGYSKHPVVGVTWYGAMNYAKWVGKRLPTEVEWEIASCGGDEDALYPTGDDIEKTQANFFSSDTTPVMSYAPNGYGLYDMAGNVYEWCHDWYGYNYYEASVQEPENPKGPLQGVYRVLRGGCWKSLKEDLRCSRRHRNNPGTVNGTYGFRCVTDVESS